MNKLLIIGSLLTGLILSCSIAVINSHTLLITVNQPESFTFSSRFRTREDYTFIWEEYEDAPSDQQGDDSVVFGPSFGPYHNYSELVNKLKNLNTTYPEIIQVFTIGKTYFGREIYCVRITNEMHGRLTKTEMVLRMNMKRKTLIKMDILIG